MSKLLVSALVLVGFLLVVPAPALAAPLVTWAVEDSANVRVTWSGFLVGGSFSDHGNALFDYNAGGGYVVIPAGQMTASGSIVVPFAGNSGSHTVKVYFCSYTGCDTGAAGQYAEFTGPATVLATPTPAPTPVPTPIVTATPAPAYTPMATATPVYSVLDLGASGAAVAGPDLGGGGLIWTVLNSWLISIEDTVLVFWPSTPQGLKMSSLLQPVITAFPSAPWWLLASFVTYFTFISAAVALIKAWKLIWP